MLDTRDERYWKLGFNPIPLNQVDAILRSDEVDEETSSVDIGNPLVGTRLWTSAAGVMGALP